MLYYIFLSLLIISFFLLLQLLLFTLYYRKQQPLSMPLARYPRVSVLKPMKGIDDELEKNLESFYALDYPDFELIFGFDHLNDAALPIVMKVKERYPNVPTKIVETGVHKVANPKVDTLAKIAVEGSGELYWVSDSNTRVEKDTLRRFVRTYLEKDAKVIFSLIRGSGSCTPGSAMANAYVNLFVSGSIVVAWSYLRKAIIVGKSIVLEKAALESIGGFDRFNEFLAEDFLIGEIYREHGVPVTLECLWISNVSSTLSVEGFTARATRWAKMRFHLNRPAFVLELLLNPIAIACLALPFLGTRGLPLLGAAAVLKIAIEYVSFLAVSRDERKRGFLLLVYPLLVVAKDLLLLGVYVIPFFSSSVNWRGRKIRIGERSRIHPVLR